MPDIAQKITAHAAQYGPGSALLSFTTGGLSFDADAAGLTLTGGSETFSATGPGLHVTLTRVRHYFRDRDALPGGSAEIERLVFQAQSCEIAVELRVSLITPLI